MPAWSAFGKKSRIRRTCSRFAGAVDSFFSPHAATATAHAVARTAAVRRRIGTVTGGVLPVGGEPTAPAGARPGRGRRRGRRRTRRGGAGRRTRAGGRGAGWP